jgi:serine/threonine protein kinase
MPDANIIQLTGQLLGQYQLRKLIGKGGMSAVYRAYQNSLDREVAVKVLAVQLSTDPNYVARFRQEARTAASLEHTNIVPVYDSGVQDGISFVVMRLLTGGSLARRLAIARQGGHPLPALQEVAWLLQTIAGALDYAHQRDVIHRDIKPSNIMFNVQGAPYLVDFGIAHVLTANLSLTGAGQTIGTPNYMAPEQWQDAPLTPAVDQYALGVLMYNALSGELPFEATTSHAMMYKHLHETPPPVHELRDDLPEAISPVLARALAKSPEARYPSVRHFGAAFAEAATSAPGTPTGFFTFKLPNIVVPDTDPTPPSNAMALPASQAQAVPLANESVLAGEEPPIPPQATIASTVPPLPEAIAPAAQQDKAPAAKAPTVQMQAVDPGVYAPPAAAPSPQARSASPRQQPMPRPRRQQSSRYTGIIIAGVVIAIIAIVLIVLGILWVRDYNSRILQPGAEIDVTIEAVENVSDSEDTSIQPTALPNPNDSTGNIGSALALSANQITVASAPNVQQASRVHSQPDTPVRMVAFSSTGMLASAHGDSVVRLWRNGPTGLADTLTGHSGVVYTLAFSTDGRLLASAGEDGTIRLWNTADGALNRILTGHTGLVRGLAFSPDDQLLASAGEDRSVRIWDVAAGTNPVTLSGFESRMLDVAFSPDGSTLATAGNDTLVRLWDPRTGIEQRRFVGHSESVRSVTFSPNGRVLASSSLDNTIRLWDVNTGSTLHTLSGHNSDVWWTAYDPAGDVLASGGRDNTVRLWNASSGAQLRVLDGHSGWVLGVAFSPDGSTLASGSGDGTIRLWAPAG